MHRARVLRPTGCLRAVAQPRKTSGAARFFSCLDPEAAAVPPACSPRPRASSGSRAPKLASRAADSRVLNAGVRADRFVGCSTPVAGEQSAAADRCGGDGGRAPGAVAWNANED